MDRYIDRERYFSELAETSAHYYLDVVRPWLGIGPGTRVLEIGCGEGGNLLPFARAGCTVVGVDLSAGKVANAVRFFAERQVAGRFVCLDFLQADASLGTFDLILVKDVIEHIAPRQKEAFMLGIRRFMRPGGIVFLGFPAWQMPFGGHQQTARRTCALVPWIHLLPRGLYKAWLRLAGVDSVHVRELMDIRAARMTVESFGRLSGRTGFRVLDRTLWLVNPHYRAKFGLHPLRLRAGLDRIPFLRNFLATSCFYVLTVPVSGTGTPRQR